MGEIMNERTITLIGLENFQKLEEKHILIIGLGGVGGTTLEALVRCGIKHITIIDSDKFEISNLNRQILSTTKTIGKNKVDVAKKRALSINSDININEINTFLTKENIDILEKYDYIIDACDTIPTKVELIKYALKNNIKIISCMGTGKKMDIEKLEITTLAKTINDPLAKKLRNMLKKENITTNIPVVSSIELPQKEGNIISSMIFVPSTAGLLLASFVINDIIKTE